MYHQKPLSFLLQSFHFDILTLQLQSTLICHCFALLKLIWQKTVRFSKPPNSVWLWSVFNSSTCHNPVFFPHCAECAAKPQTIKLEWKTNKCLIKTHSEEIASNPVWWWCIAIAMRYLHLKTEKSYVVTLEWRVWAFHRDDARLFICTYQFVFDHHLLAKGFVQTDISELLTSVLHQI